MAEQGYFLSERDRQRVEDAIRRVERMAAVNFNRRMPVNTGMFGGGENYPIADERVGMYASFTLTKEDHERKVLYADLAGGDGLTENLTITAAVNPTKGDTYFIYTNTCGNPYYARIVPNVGQSIICPSREIKYGDGYYLELGRVGYASTLQQVILVCCATNKWVTWSTSSSWVVNSSW